MIYLLRDLGTGRFFKDPAEWTEGQEKARRFEAIEVAAGLEASDLEVFFGIGGIRLPVQNPEDSKAVFKQTNF